MQVNSRKIDEKPCRAFDRKRLFGVSATGQRVGTEEHLNEKTRPEKK